MNSYCCSLLRSSSFHTITRYFFSSTIMHSINNDNSTDYTNWSQQELISRIYDLEHQTIHPKNPNPKNKKNKMIKKQLRKQALNRPFDFTNNVPRRKVAFRIAYLGWPFEGFASQAHTDQTVEAYLFKALKQTQLVKEISPDIEYTRCGRTDKGVSAVGNVISLIVRSRLRRFEPNNDTVDQQQEGQEELPYLTMLNRCLPDQIRVLAWTPVPNDFSARFSCTTRTYNYYFPGLNLDIGIMQSAARSFIGTHNFVQFCKLDVSKPDRNYERTMHDVSIQPVQEYMNAAVSEGNRFLWYKFIVKGSAFLYHQIRYMVQVLFLIGQKKESPKLIDLLLTGQQGRPQYDLAPELPLVLTDCHFNQLQWRYTDQQKELAQPLTSLVQHCWWMYDTHKTQLLVLDSLLNQLMCAQLDAATLSGFTQSQMVGTSLAFTTYDQVFPGITLGPMAPWGTKPLVPIVRQKYRERQYVPILNRPRCDSVAVVQRKYLERQCVPILNQPKL